MADPPRTGGNVLTQKAGPLPIWAWALAGGALIFAVYRYRQAKAAASSAAQTLNLPANADVGMAGQGAPLGGWGGGGGTSGGTSAGGPTSSSGTGTGGAGLDGQALPPTATSLPLSPNGTAAPTVGSSGQPIGVPLPGDVALPQPSANNFAATQAAAGNLGAGQSGIFPNGLRVTRTTLPNGSVSYVYS